MSVRHQGLRDAYFKKLNALIADACRRWMEFYDDPNDTLRTDYFLRDIGALPFWRQARDGKKNSENPALTTQSSYERFCERIKPWASEPLLSSFQHFVDHTFLVPELSWNENMNSFHSIFEVLEDLDLKRPKTIETLFNRDYAEAIAAEVQHRYYGNRLYSSLNIAHHYISTAAFMAEQSPNDPTPYIALCSQAFPILVITQNHGLHLHFHFTETLIQNNPWIYPLMFPVNVNKALFQGATQQLLQHDASRRLDGAAFYFDYHAHHDQKLKFDPRPDDWIDVHAADILLAKATSRGFGIGLPDAHPLILPYIRLTQVALGEHLLALDPSYQDPIDLNMQSIVDYYEKEGMHFRAIKDYPYAKEVIAQVYLGATRAQRHPQLSPSGRVTNDPILGMGSFIRSSVEYLETSTSLLARAELLVTSAHYMSQVGNAALEAKALARAARNYEFLGHKRRERKAIERAVKVELEPYTPKIPANDPHYPLIARLIQDDEQIGRKPGQKRGRKSKRRLAPKTEEM